MTKRKFLFNLSRSSYEKEWGTEYHRPGFRTRLVTWILRIMPKVRSLQVARVPRANSGSREDVHGQLQRDRRQLSRAARERERRAVRTGEREFRYRRAAVAAGKYLGADLAYDKLLGKLADRKFAGVSPELRANVLDYYKDRKAPAAPATQKAGAAWAKVLVQLDGLQSAAAAPPAEVP